jgi:hypothetical protein
MRQNGIDANGRNIAFGGRIEVEPPHPVVFAWGWEGIPILIGKQLLEDYQRDIGPIDFRDFLEISR